MDESPPDHPAQPSFQFYHSLRAVKVLLAALRSTLTVLALRMEGPLSVALEEQLPIPCQD
jgi:hypothetical protein